MDLISILMAEEAFRAHVYDDLTGKPIVPGSTVRGHPTIGYGLACDVNGLTQAEAEMLLRNRATIAMTQAAEDLGMSDWVKLNEVRQAALSELAFQIGGGGLAAFQNMLASIRAADWQRVHDEALASKWAQQTPARAQRVAGMLLTGEWSAAALKP